MQHIKVPNTRELSCAHTRWKYIKQSFLYHYTNLGKIFDFKLVNTIFSCLDVNSWHLLAGTCQVQLVCFLTQLLPLFWGILSFSHTHHVPMQELANCLPCMGGYLLHTGMRGFLFALKTVDLFYFTQDGVVTCEWHNNTYNIIFHLA